MADKAKKTKATKATKKAADAVAQQQKTIRKGNANLVPFTEDQSHDKAVENGKKGGIRSGEAKREKKTMKETLEFILAADKIPTGNKAISNVKNAMLTFGYTEEQINMKTLFAFSMYINAISGKAPKYSELILGIIGEMPAEKHEITGSQGTPLMPNTIYDVSKIPHEELMALTKAAFAKEGKGTEGK